MSVPTRPSADDQVKARRTAWVWSVVWLFALSFVVGATLERQPESVTRWLLTGLVCVFITLRLVRSVRRATGSDEGAR